MMREEQAKVSAFIQAYGLGQNPQARMLDLISEVGELSKELLKASGYGELPVELTASIKEELGDCLFSVLCLSEALGTDAQEALDMVLRKYEQRFAATGQIGNVKPATRGAT